MVTFCWTGVWGASLDPNVMATPVAIGGAGVTKARSGLAVMSIGPGLDDPLVIPLVLAPMRFAMREEARFLVAMACSSSRASCSGFSARMAPLRL